MYLVSSWENFLPSAFDPNEKRSFIFHVLLCNEGLNAFSSRVLARYFYFERALLFLNVFIKEEIFLLTPQSQKHPRLRAKLIIRRYKPEMRGGN